MCGIACCIAFKDPTALGARISRMNARVGHRGPDGSGTLVTGKVALGHTRLAIIDLNDRASQPMTRGRRHISFNGEIYNYLELKRELESVGHRFTTTSDTEVLLAALEAWGMAALAKLIGMFAFIYVDENAAAVYIVRDRFGKKPLVYARGVDSFVAASEAKQIVALEQGAPKFDPETVTRFLVNGSLNSTERTFFDGIVELRGGHFGRLDLTNCSFKIQRWYHLAENAAKVVPARNYDEARETVRELLLDAVRLRHRADVQIGACLSGGIDSSAIVALSAALGDPDKLLTITSFAPSQGYDERPFSREIVKRFGVRSLEIEPDTALIWNADAQKAIAYFQDQPIPGGSHYNEYCVFKAAHDAGLKVMLDGQGADEYFGGYGEFWLAAQFELLKQGRITDFQAGIRQRSQATNRPVLSVLRNLLMRLLPQRARLDPGDWIGPHQVPWLHAERRSARMPMPRNFAELSVHELETSSMPYQLHSEDRSSMRCSVESRLPFMDHRLVEAVLAMQTDYKIGRGIQKRILRDAVPELPTMVARRKDKIGFAAPDSLALRGNEASVRDQIAATAQALDGLVDRDTMLAAFDSMARENTWYDGIFFRMVSLGGWIAAFKDNTNAPGIKQTDQARL